MPRPLLSLPQAPSRRSTAALITAIAGLISAIAAFRRQPPEPMAKESYQVLQKAFIEQDKELEEVRKDLATLRTSFEDYLKAKEGSANVVAESNGEPKPTKVQVQPSPAAHTSVLPPTKTVMIPPVKASATAKPPPPPDFNVLKTKAGL